MHPLSLGVALGIALIYYYKKKRAQSKTQSVPITFSNKVLNKHKCYKADLLVDNTTRAFSRTFFPAEWPPKKVMDAIAEAYEDYREKGALSQPDKEGKYWVKGITKDGIEIEMVITKDGVMKTAFPSQWSIHELR